MAVDSLIASNAASLAQSDSKICKGFRTFRETELDHPSWKEAPGVLLEAGWDGRAHPDLKTEVRFLWEPRYFYAGFRCPYQELNIDGSNAIPPYRSPTAATDGGQAVVRSGFEVRARIREEIHSWTLEMKIPAMSVAEHPLEAGMVWSINVYRADGKGQSRRYLALMPTCTETPNYHVPSRFGRIKFLK